MRLSIVIPTKNEEGFLPNALRSLERQTMKSFEVIVADAHSSDRTREIACLAGARVVDGGLPGPGRNAGARNAIGDWLLFLDADVVLSSPSFLEDCLYELEARRLDVGGCRVAPDGGDRLDRVLHGAYNLYALATERMLPHAPGFCLFVRRSTHEAIEGFDERVLFAEDHDYARRAKRQGFHFGIIRAHAVPASVRRMHKEGRARIAAKYIYSEAYMLTRGSMKKLPFQYEFGKFEKKHDT